MATRIAAKLYFHCGPLRKKKYIEINKLKIKQRKD